MHYYEFEDQTQTTKKLMLTYCFKELNLFLGYLIPLFILIKNSIINWGRVFGSHLVNYKFDLPTFVRRAYFFGYVSLLILLLK